ncbi:MAG: amino acid ABC transporter permease [Parvibaculaceae bacterium]
MRFDLSVILDNWDAFLHGTVITLYVGGISIVAAFAMAIPLALMALSEIRILRVASTVFLEFFRNLPFIVVVYIFYYGFPTLHVRLPETWVGILALSFFTSAYFSETIRGAILSVPKGQMEAARAIGLSYFQGMKDIVAPQTLRFMLPPCTSTCISTLKETSVLSVITVGELTFQGLVVQGETFAPFEVFVATALIYWLITGVFAAGMRRSERLSGASRDTFAARTNLADRYLRIEG